ncbi:hypothetical protein D3C81_2147890 [compost metagenome]
MHYLSPLGIFLLEDENGRVKSQVSRQRYVQEEGELILGYFNYMDVMVVKRITYSG